MIFNQINKLQNNSSHSEKNIFNKCKRQHLVALEEYKSYCK